MRDGPLADPALVDRVGCALVPRVDRAAEAARPVVEGPVQRERREDDDVARLEFGRQPAQAEFGAHAAWIAAVVAAAKDAAVPELQPLPVVVLVDVHPRVAIADAGDAMR